MVAPDLTSSGAPQFPHSISMRRSTPGGGRADRQLDDEQRPALGRAGLDAPAVVADDLPHDVEPEPRHPLAFSNSGSRKNLGVAMTMG